MERVVIVMSTYNGERYLAPQLDSILAQTAVSPLLWIRDDGSTDQTPRMLHDYSRRDPRVLIYAGSHVGAAHSFMHAVATCPHQADYFGFSDQDDVWLPDKLESSLEAMRSLDVAGTPCMICSTVW